VPRTTRVTGRTCRRERERESLVFVVVFFVILLCVLPLFSISKKTSLSCLSIATKRKATRRIARDNEMATTTTRGRRRRRRREKSNCRRRLLLSSFFAAVFFTTTTALFSSSSSSFIVVVEAREPASQESIDKFFEAFDEDDDDKDAADSSSSSSFQSLENLVKLAQKVADESENYYASSSRQSDDDDENDFATMTSRATDGKSGPSVDVSDDDLDEVDFSDDFESETDEKNLWESISQSGTITNECGYGQSKEYSLCFKNFDEEEEEEEEEESGGRRGERSGGGFAASRQATTVPVNVIGGALVWFEIAVDGLASPSDAGISNRESRSRGNSKIVLEAKPLGKPWRVLESYDSETYAISGASSADDETISERNVNVNSLASFDARANEFGFIGYRVEVPKSAESSATKFRWRQVNNNEEEEEDGTNDDSNIRIWAIDDVVIERTAIAPHALIAAVKTKRKTKSKFSRDEHLDNVYLSISFSKSVYGFDANGLKVGNGTVLALSQARTFTGTDRSISSSHFVATVKPIVPNDGDWVGPFAVSIQIPGGVCTNADGRANVASNTLKLRRVSAVTNKLREKMLEVEGEEEERDEQEDATLSIGALKKKRRTKESQFGDENEIKKKRVTYEEITLGPRPGPKDSRWAAVVAEETELNTSATYDKTFVVVLDDDTMHLHDPDLAKDSSAWKDDPSKVGERVEIAQEIHGRMKRSKRKPSREAFEKMEDEIVTLKKVQERALRRWKDADSGGFNHDVGSYTDAKEKAQQSLSPFAKEIKEEEMMEEMLELSKDAKGDEELKKKVRTDSTNELDLQDEEDDYDDDTFASGEISPEEEKEEDTTLADLKRDLEESERLHRELASEVEMSHKMREELDSELEELRSLEKEKMMKKKKHDSDSNSGSSDSGIEDEDGFLQGEGHSTIDGRSVEFREDGEDDDDDFATVERLAHEMSDMFEEEKEAEELVKKSRGDEAPEKEEGMSRDINADAEAIKEEARIIREELKAEKELLNKEKEMKAKLDEELLKLKTAQEVEVLASDEDDDIDE